MTNERELDEGLAAFDQLGREMAETNRLLRAVRSDQATRNQQEQALSTEMRTALKQATGASQKALQASQTEIRSSLLWTGLTAFLIVLVAFGGGFSSAISLDGTPGTRTDTRKPGIRRPPRAGRIPRPDSELMASIGRVALTC